MKITTKNPIEIVGQNRAKAKKRKQEKYWKKAKKRSRFDGDDMGSNFDGDEFETASHETGQTSTQGTAKKGMSPETAQQLGQLGTQLAGQFLNRQLTNVEQVCGRRPTLPGRKRDEWNQCSQRFQQGGGAMPSMTPSFTPDYSSMPSSGTPASDEDKKKKTMMWVAIGGGVVVLGVLAYFMLRNKPAGK